MKPTLKWVSNSEKSIDFEWERGILKHVQYALTHFEIRIGSELLLNTRKQGKDHSPTLTLSLISTGLFVVAKRNNEVS